MDILKDLGIGIPSGLKSSEKQDLANIVNSALSNSDTTKTNMINIINSKFGTSLTLDKNWSDIQSVLNSWVNPKANDKKWASGTLGSTGSTTIPISGLTFTPTIILMAGRSSLQGGTSSTVMASMSWLAKNSAGYTNWLSLTNMGTTVSPQPTAGSFTILNNSNGNLLEFAWLAIE